MRLAADGARSQMLSKTAGCADCWTRLNRAWSDRGSSGASINKTLTLLAVIGLTRIEAVPIAGMFNLLNQMACRLRERSVDPRWFRFLAKRASGDFVELECHVRRRRSAFGRMREGARMRRARPLNRRPGCCACLRRSTATLWLFHARCCARSRSCLRSWRYR